MSLITTCPACATSFYVTQDQLAAHHGDVRCGKCQHVFNARNKVTELAPPPETILDFDEEQIPDVDELEIIEEPSVAPVFQILETPTEPVTTKPEPVTSMIEEPVPVFSQPAMSTPKAPADNAQRFSFSNKTKPKSHPMLFASLSALLILAAMAQTAYFQRTPLSIRFPPFKPYLVKACQVIGCEVSLPKHIDQITIDDSDIQEDADHEGLIHLSATVINNASYAQEYPLLELSLTDINDKPILRRAFQPSEYLPIGTNVSSGIGAGEELHIKLNLTASGEPVAGYRVLVVY